MTNEKMNNSDKTENQKEEEKLNKETNPSKQIIFNPVVLKRHQRYFYVFLSLSVLSIIDIGTRQIVSAQYGLSDTGLVSFFVGAIFGVISLTISGIVITVLNLIFSFAILWIPIAIIEYFHVKKIEKVKNN